MKLHEYQAKKLLRDIGLDVPIGDIASTSEGAAGVFKRCGLKPVVIKAQVHTGGRGKAGGIKTADTVEMVVVNSAGILEKRLVTAQTGPEGKQVHQLLIEETVPIAKERYLALVLDRSADCVAVIGCAEGGMEIEEIARRTPDKILTLRLDPLAGLNRAQAETFLKQMGLSGDQIAAGIEWIEKLARAFETWDASLIEINPWIEGPDGRFIALDAKVVLDDNGLFRHPDLAALRDEREEDPRELEAARHKINYIALRGNIGCMVNGAGLAMATMDLIKLHGGQPANFLDVGGGATQDQVEQAFRLILSDSQVKAVLVNIFGGIVKCDLIANGILAAARSIGLKIPLVVRLEGTNADSGREILKKSGLAITPAESFDEAARRVVEVAKN